MGQGITHQLQHLSVQLGFRAALDQRNLLTQFLRQVAHQAGQVRPGLADRLHACLGHAVLQVGYQPGQALQRRLEFAVVQATGQTGQLISGQDQLRDQGHQLLDDRQANPDGLLAALYRRRRRIFWFCRRVARCRIRRCRFGRDIGRGDRLFIRRRGGGPSPGRLCAVSQDRQALNQLPVVPGRLASRALDGIEQKANAVQTGKDQGHGLAVGHQATIAEPAQHALAGMGQGFQPWQVKKAAGALDGVEHAENSIDQRRIVRRLLETDDIGVQERETLESLGQELLDEVVHAVRSVAGEDGAQWPFFRLH